MASRFSSTVVQSALERLVLERTEEVLDVPEAVRFLLTVKSGKESFVFFVVKLLS